MWSSTLSLNNTVIQIVEDNMVGHHCIVLAPNGHIDIIQYLIRELGCDPALTDNYGDMPIHEACLDGQLSVVKYLITKQHCDPNIRGTIW